MAVAAQHRDRTRVIAAIVGLLVWNGRRRGSRTIALDAALTLSGWWILLSAVGAGGHHHQGIHRSTGPNSTARRTCMWTGPVNLPCSEYGDSATTMLTCSGEALTDFTVGNASLGLRLLAAAAQLSTSPCPTMPAVIVAVICFYTLRGRVFSHMVTRALTGGAVRRPRHRGGRRPPGWHRRDHRTARGVPPDSEWYPVVFQLTVTPWPFLAALALAALAAVFRQGMRLEQDRRVCSRRPSACRRTRRGLV